MKLEVKYKGSILNLPASVADFAPNASELELKVILSIFNYSQYFNDFDSSISSISDLLGASEEEIICALSFWIERGVIKIDGLEPIIMNKIEADCADVNREPCYTGKQISDYMAENESFRALCYECEKVLEKHFTASDFNNVRNLKSYYGFSDEYILLLLAHCRDSDKASWSYIRKTASSLYDEDIATYEKLEEHFSARRNKNSLEYKIRKLLGIGERELIKRERSHIEKWISLNIGFDLIKTAYEVTVDKTGKPSCAYMSKVLENWLSSGIRTAEDAISSMESFKNQQKMSMSSFDTDDFFEAALKRSEEKMLARSKK